MIVLIIIQIVLAIICLVLALGLFANEKYGLGILMIFWVVVNGVGAFNNVNEFKNPTVKTHVVKNVKEYYVDSTTVINGADTTNTYTITYIK